MLNIKKLFNKLVANRAESREVKRVKSEAKAYKPTKSQARKRQFHRKPVFFSERGLQFAKLPSGDIYHVKKSGWVLVVKGGK